ncbi:hypothetical protein Scep_013026 [Stephania cephalantha]|uniref:Uncharacterized protein n=1 Tax=Stephania cephalantha TaxID=152367 RepID=A0AAP0JG79_9MAGN
MQRRTGGPGVDEQRRMYNGGCVAAEQVCRRPYSRRASGGRRGADVQRTGETVLEAASAQQAAAAESERFYRRGAERREEEVCGQRQMCSCDSGCVRRT